MLGSQTWFVVFGVPMVGSLLYVSTCRTYGIRWREKLMSPALNDYPPIDSEDMIYFRRAAPSAWTPNAATPAEPSTVSESLMPADNIGLRVEPALLPPEQVAALLTELRRLARSTGTHVDTRQLQGFLQNMAIRIDDEAAGGSSSSLGSHAEDTEFYRHIRVVSDHAEDTQQMSAPWGTGSRIDLAKMPASLRFVVQQTQNKFATLGRLRHVCIVYSPTGRLYRDPRPQKMFDGHDCVLLPLRRDGTDTVVTFVPTMRSRLPRLREVMRRSWTSFDVDACVPCGAALRVYGKARYDYGWGIRPGVPWFGDPTHAPLSLTHARGAAGATPRWWRRLPFLRSSSVQASASPRAAATIMRRDSLDVQRFDQEAALVTLCFEGPNGKRRPRALLLQPEHLVFGPTPSIETYETWVNDRPTVEAVRKEGILRFVLRNYTTMFSVS